MSSVSPEFALKEWAVVCELLAAGEICLLPRKGGIREFGGPGVFELEHENFLLFPTREHEKLERIKPEFLRKTSAAGVDAECAADSDTLKLDAFAKAERIWKVPSREAFDRLEDLHPWLPPAIDMRFDYKPENPLYLVALRVSRLREAKVIPHRAEYRGCRSWVPLLQEDRPDVAGVASAMSDTVFAAVLARVDAVFAVK
jgi:hypothetical protein